jgi:predicted nucleic acid-binding protein
MVLSELLDSAKALTHPFVIGELALGNLRDRAVFLESLHGMTQAKVAANEEVLRFIERNALHGLGIGYVDAHLLASVRLTRGAAFWTRDRRLQRAADKLGLAWVPRALG